MNRIIMANREFNATVPNTIIIVMNPGCSKASGLGKTGETRMRMKRLKLDIISVKT